MDKLTLTDIAIHTRIGTHDWEQQAIQVLKIDLMMLTDAQLIAQSDAIEKAINYDEVLAHLKNFANTEHFQLLETFADKCAQSLLATFNTPRLQLTVHKPSALLEAKDVSISIERQRA